MNLPLVEQDRFWGVVLILLGLASIAFQPFERFDKMVNASTDKALTFILIGLGLVAVAIAFRGSAALKALAIVWIVTP